MGGMDATGKEEEEKKKGRRTNGDQDVIYSVHCTHVRSRYMDSEATNTDPVLSTEAVISVIVY